MSESRRKKNQDILRKYKIIGQDFYSNLLRVIAFTMVSTIIYLMFFPVFVFNFVITQGLDEQFYQTFPELEATDIYSISAFVVFFIIHILVIRLFIHDNYIFIIATITVAFVLGLNFIIGEAIYGLIAFTQAESTVYSSYVVDQLGLEILPGYQLNFDISFLTLIGLILLYDVLLIFFIIVLRPEKFKRGKK